jgi:hypothetical protein
MFLRAALAVLLSSATAENSPPTREATLALDELPDGAGCPSAAVLGRALHARLPGIISNQAGGSGPDPLRLHLHLDDSGTAGVRFALVDLTGQIVLERSFANPGASADDRAGGCAALADTIALVVERYLRQLGYRAPAAVVRPDPPALGARAAPPEIQATRAAPLARDDQLLLAAGISLAPGRGGPTRVEPELAADWMWLPLVLSLRAALSLPIEVAVPSTDQGSFRYTALPLRAGIGVPAFLPRGKGWAAISALVGVDLFRAETRAITVPEQVQGVQAVAELGLVAALHLGQRLSLRPQILVGFRQERAFQVRDPGPAGAALYLDHRFSLRLGLDLAFAVGKN